MSAFKFPSYLQILIAAAFLSLVTTQSFGANDSRPTHVPRQIMVKFKENINSLKELSHSTSTFARKHGLTIRHTFKTPAFIAASSRGKIQLLEHPSRSSEDLIAALQGAPEIEWIEPNYYRYLQNTPNDPHFDKLWALKNDGQRLEDRTGTKGFDIGFSKARYFSSQRNLEIVVAVADTGIDPHHPDLTNQLWNNPNEIADNDIDDDENGYIDDIHGYHFALDSGELTDSSTHGTHVSGTIAAESNNDIGISGAFPEAKIITLGVSSDGIRIETASFIKACNYLVGLKNTGINIIALNASFCGYNYSNTEKAAVENLRDAGIILCAAAGNHQTDIDLNKSYPGCYDLDNIITVAGNDSNHELYRLTNYGKSEVDLAAPATSIYSTVPLDKAEPESRLKVGSTTYEAKPIFDAGKTNTDGINGILYDCKLGKASEFPDAVRGNLALIERGEITFANKVINAAASGAEGVIIYNNVEDETGKWVMESNRNYVPAIRLTKAQGALLLEALNQEATLYNYPISDNAYSFGSGTSMAAPHVSAAVAFAAYNYPDESYTERIARILENITPADAFKDKVATGGILNLKNIVDTDRDEMPDWWELMHFSNLDKTPDIDSDGDGLTDSQEYLTNTDPKAAQSTIKFENLEIHPDKTSPLQFKTAPQRYYQLQRNDKGLSSEDWYNVGNPIKGDNSIKTINDEPTLKNTPLRFYRLKISAE